MATIGLQEETMQSNNPVFRRSEEFNRSGANGYGNQTYGSDPAQWGTGIPGRPHPGPVSTGPMTIDSVVQKTAITLGVVILAAAATWVLTPDITSTDATWARSITALTSAAWAPSCSRWSTRSSA